MTDLVYWKLSDETKEVLKQIDEEIVKSEQELVEGSLVISPALDREYCRAIGYLEGLRFIKEKLSIGEIEQL